MTKSKQFLLEVARVRRPLEAWRKIRKHRARIPEEIWMAMAKLAKTYGISPVSRVLRVEYYALKGRLAESPGASPSAASQPTFVELKPRPLSSPMACRVELEERSGAKMTLHLDTSNGVNALALAQAFWRRGA